MSSELRKVIDRAGADRNRDRIVLLERGFEFSDAGVFGIKAGIGENEGLAAGMICPLQELDNLAACDVERV
jgi:hypothetical protein